MVGFRTTGYWWFAVMALGLVQLLLAPAIPIPWLPADSVRISSSEPWILWALLIVFVLLSSFPWDKMGLGLVRGVSAFAQGFIIGHLVVFDSSTVLARLVFSATLGVANAYDRFGSVRRIQDIEAATQVQLEQGASGTYTYNGEEYPIMVQTVQGDDVLIEYVTRPFFFGNTQTITAYDVNLVLKTHAITKVETLISDYATPGFQYRPWGYALGISVSQWVLTSFTVGDSFVAGMLTQQAIVILSVPITTAILFAIAKYTKNDVILCVCFVYCVGCCLFGIIAYGLPMIIGVTAFAMELLVAHQVVAFIAIPADIFVFLKLTSPSAEDLATTGFAIFFMKAEAMIAKNAAVGQLGNGQARPLLAN